MDAVRMGNPPRRSGDRTHVSTETEWRNARECVGPHGQCPSRSRFCYIDNVSVASTHLLTADDLLAKGDIGRCELIYGELVMMSPAGLEHGVVAMRFGRYLAAWVDDHELGICLAAETGFKIESNPDLVRAPDASFIRKERLRGPITRKFFDGVPDLAVDVLSPEDCKRDIAEKVNMWLAHGTQVAWVADPKSMTVTIHRVGAQPMRLAAGDEIANEPLLPGFTLPLAKVFKQP